MEPEKKIKKYVRYSDGAELYSMGIQSFMRIAKEAKAVYKIRGIALVNTEEMDKYLASFKLQ